MKNIKILLINDGNRRWAKEHNLTIEEGYIEMSKKIAFVCDELLKKGINSVYIPTCSVNNLKRPPEQVACFLKNYIQAPEHSKNEIKIVLHGNLSLLPEKFKKMYLKRQEETAKNKDFTLHYLVAYSLEDQIVKLYNRLHDSYKQIDLKILSENLDIEPIDLIIRTGKRKRLSSFVPIGSPYAEIYFEDILFPEINSEYVDKALKHYEEQERNYGR